jgi:hypothetical protein
MMREVFVSTRSTVIACAALAGVLLSSSAGGEAPAKDAHRRVIQPNMLEHKQPKPFDQPDEAQRFYLQKRLPAGETALSPARYLPAKAQMSKMPRYSSKLGRLLGQNELATPIVGAWENLGPGNIGGRTRRLVIHPTTPTTMYAGAVDGGVWKSTDGGATWAPLDDMMANLAVVSLVMDPADSDTLYAGTGEGFFNADGVRGAGIFKTIDAGATWSQIAATNTSDFFFVNDLVISPNSDQQLYAATRTGVFRTVDGGAIWTKVIDAVTPTNVNGCTDLAIKSSGPADTVFAACGTFAQATIYRNTDAGGAGTWDSVLTEAGMGRTHLALAPSNENTIYALSASITAGTYNNGLHKVFRSTTNGDSGSWTTQVANTDATLGNTLLLTNAPFAVCVGQFLNQGWYDNILAVDPADENILWAGGVDLFRSNDGGANWGIGSLWFADPADPFFAHADQHVIAFDPGYNGTSNKTMYVGNDGGIFKTTDARAAVDPPVNPNICDTASTTIAVPWESLNNGYDVTQFYHGTVYPDGLTYFGGTQDNGTVRGTDAGGDDAWAMIFGGDGGYTAQDPGNTDILFTETTGFSIRKSIDGGTTFNSAVSGITGDNGAAFILPYQMDPGNAQRLWTGGWFIWRTINQAASWVRASAITDGVGSVAAVANAPTNGDNVIVGMSDGFIHFNTSALSATSVTVWPSTQPRTGRVSSVTFDPQNAMVAYATFSTFGGTHVWKTTNAGASWTGLDGTGPGTLPDLPVHVIVVDPNDSNRLYLGTDLGVFVSTNGGTTWAVENTNFANVVVEWLRLADLGGQRHLYAFTHGRSAWRTAVAASAIFADGFNSGNTAAWSVTVP